jgi:hypothetical protein
MSYQKTGSTLINPAACEIAPELAAVQGLMPISPEDKQALRESIARDGIREPLRGYFDQSTGKFQILSGQNRWQIALELNLPLVPCEAIDTDDREAFAIDENRARRQLTTDDKKRLAAWLLKRNPERSNLSIAKSTGLDDKTVGKVRREAERRSEIPNVAIRTDSKGRKQVARKPKPAKKPLSDATGSPQSALKSQGKGVARGEPENALMAFNKALNEALRIVEMQPASVLKVAVRHAKSWLKDLERKHRSAERVG